MTDTLTRPELVRGYTQIEKHRDRVLGLVRIEHRELPDGRIESRVYAGGRLVECRRNHPAGATPAQGPRGYGGWRLA